MTQLTLKFINSMHKRCLVFAILLIWFKGVQAQTLPPFWEEIKAFKAADKEHFPPGQAILFTGSSSIRMWQNLQEMFPGYSVINRGFGGSQLPDLYRYAPSIIYPYHPKEIVIYSGENDIATGTVSAEMVLSRFDQVFRLIRSNLPDIPVVFISIKPAPSRIQYKSIVVAANKLIKDYLQDKPKTYFVDIYSSMVNENGDPRPELFIEDDLHMNQQGYAIWQKALQPYLLK
jgi:lysophospholipase L1-like esterase